MSHLGTNYQYAGCTYRTMADKYIREIEEILKESESSRGKSVADGVEETPKSSGLLSRLGRLRIILRVSPNKVVLAGIILIVVSFALYNAFNYLFVNNIKFLLPIWAGLILFVIVYGLLFVKPGSEEKQWRGRMLDDGIQPSKWERLRRWIER
jgi:hypothetical protein